MIKGDRFEAAASLALSGSWLSRRVNTIFVDDIQSGAIRRKTSLHLSHSALTQGAPRSQRRILPLGFFRKGLVFDLSLRDETGKAIPVLNRAEDSEIARRVLEQCVGAAAPPRVQQALFAYAFHMAPAREIFSFIGERCTGITTCAERAWLHQARQSAHFVAMSQVIREHHILACEIELTGTDRLLKTERLEKLHEIDFPRGWRGYFRALVSATLYARFEMTLPDFGWARSDHTRLRSLQGHRISDTIVVPVAGASQPFSYIGEGDESNLDMYTHGTSPTLAYLSAAVYPPRGGLTLPPVLMSALVAVILLLGASLEYVTKWMLCDDRPDLRSVFEGAKVIENSCESSSFLWGASAGSAVTLALVIPSILLAFITFRPQMGIGEHLLMYWRATAVSSVGLLWVACSILLTPRELLTPGALWGWWVGLSIPAVVSLLLIVRGYLSLLRNTAPADFKVDVSL